MQEVLPGVFHWSAIHPRIGIRVSSYWLDDGGVLVDPLVPPEQGIEWFAGRGVEPSAIVLSNRHHWREADRFVERYACTVHCNGAGLHEFSPEQGVLGFAPGERLAGGDVACEVDAICPDETALHIPSRGAMVFADGVVRGGEYGGDGPLGFVPDSLMDDPPATKRGLLERFERLLGENEFDHLLLAHGGPVIGDGRALLAELVESGGRTAFEM
jgi:hypothetical protein